MWWIRGGIYRRRWGGGVGGAVKRGRRPTTWRELRAGRGRAACTAAMSVAVLFLSRCSREMDGSVVVLAGCAHGCMSVRCPHLCQFAIALNCLIVPPLKHDPSVCTRFTPKELTFFSPLTLKKLCTHLNFRPKFYNDAWFSSLVNIYRLVPKKTIYGGGGSGGDNKLNR